MGRVSLGVKRSVDIFLDSVMSTVKNKRTKFKCMVDLTKDRLDKSETNGNNIPICELPVLIGFNKDINLDDKKTHKKLLNYIKNNPDFSMSYISNNHLYIYYNHR